jgi:hypothetical protein
MLCQSLISEHHAWTSVCGPLLTCGPAGAMSILSRPSYDPPMMVLGSLRPHE